MSFRAAIFASILALSPSLVAALQIPILSYDMPNGDGTQHSASYNYWDVNYSGLGDTQLDGAPLSGGLGKLTDGVVASRDWRQTANYAGTGDHVGWQRGHTPNPTIIFHFYGQTTIRQIQISLDNSYDGGVAAPEFVRIDGITTPFVVPDITDETTIGFYNLDLTGDTHTIQFYQQTYWADWVFVSEIAFFDVPGVAPIGNFFVPPPTPGPVGSVPEPETWVCATLGFALVATALRRRRTNWSASIPF